MSGEIQKIIAGVASLRATFALSGIITSAPLMKNTATPFVRKVSALAIQIAYTNPQDEKGLNKSLNEMRSTLDRAAYMFGEDCAVVIANDQLCAWRSAPKFSYHESHAILQSTLKKHISDFRDGLVCVQPRLSF